MDAPPKTDAAILTSLDRRFSCLTRRALPDRYRDLLSLPRDGRHIARGAGVSYVAASFGRDSTSVGMTRFDRILSFDAETRVLEVEAGASLGKLYDFLAPKGLYLPVQPGHPQITVGGCVAFNIHGKNQFREGLFDSCIEELEIFHPANGLMTLSRSKEPELFALTCGGFGLTGVIVKAKLRTKPVPAAAVSVVNVPVASLRETFAKVEELKDRCDMLYSWNDLTCGGPGAGFVVCGKFADVAAGSRAPARADLEPGKRTYPFSAYNALSLPALNAAYRFANTRLRPEASTSFYSFTFPVVDKTFYFDLFGREGFVERQMLIQSSRTSAYIDRVESLLAAHRPLVALATVKAFKGRSRLLNYDGEGLSLSFDLVGGEDAAFHADLDALNVEMGVLDNPAKDSRLTAAVISREYPGYDGFRDGLAAFDPGRLFRSELSERLGL